MDFNRILHDTHTVYRMYIYIYDGLDKQEFRVETARYAYQHIYHPFTNRAFVKASAVYLFHSANNSRPNRDR